MTDCQPSPQPTTRPPHISPIYIGSINRPTKDKRVIVDLDVSGEVRVFTPGERRPVGTATCRVVRSPLFPEYGDILARVEFDYPWVSLADDWTLAMTIDTQGVECEVDETTGLLPMSGRLRALTICHVSEWAWTT